MIKRTDFAKQAAGGLDVPGPGSYLVDEAVAPQMRVKHVSNFSLAMARDTESFALRNAASPFVNLTHLESPNVGSYFGKPGEESALQSIRERLKEITPDMLNNSAIL